ncbi:MAG: hypothetical protein JW801_05840 [Bacteroidales bacterium]|nr:hypothetical protein [Bacteroidales bacterium]
MKRLISLLMVLTLVLSFVSCEKPGKKTPPELPPYESMAIDFSDFNGAKAAVEGNYVEEGIWSNYQWAALNVGVFNLILTVNLVVPVASFSTALHQQPVYLEDATWQWSFTVEGFASAYTARLTGQVFNDYTEWKMYIAKAGVGGFDEFMWYSGTSQNDGNSGQWILHHSATFQEPLLQIDWEKNGEEMGRIKYTLVRELNDFRAADPAYGSYIEAGRTDAELDAYYNIYLAEFDRNVDIEWSTTNYNGHIADLTYFYDEAWHCWDSLGLNKICE